MFQNILCSVANEVATVTINRPAVRNALNAATLAELGRAFETLRSDPGVQVVILTGSGDKAFVAGADISEIANLTASQGEAFARRGQSVFQSIESLDKPVIAAVNGMPSGEDANSPWRAPCESHRRMPCSDSLK
jgi:enoyl-CoA hydratase